MLSSLSSRPSLASLFPTRVGPSSQTPSQPAAAQPTQGAPSAEALRQQLFHTDRFDAGSTPVGRSQAAAAPAAPPGAVDATKLVGAAKYEPGKDYATTAHEESRPYNGQSLGTWKKAVWEEALGQGATQEQAALLVAQVMQEGGTDFNKSGSATNYGPFNLNQDLLKKFGGLGEGQDLQALNGTDANATRLNVKAALNAMNTMGADRYLHHVRGGQTNFDNPDQRISGNPEVKDGDARLFANSLASNASKVLEAYRGDSNWLQNNQRLASVIPNI